MPMHRASILRRKRRAMSSNSDDGHHIAEDVTADVQMGNGIPAAADIPEDDMSTHSASASSEDVSSDGGFPVVPVHTAQAMSSTETPANTNDVDADENDRHADAEGPAAVQSHSIPDEVHDDDVDPTEVSEVAPGDVQVDLSSVAGKALTLSAVAKGAMKFKGTLTDVRKRVITRMEKEKRMKGPARSVKDVLHEIRVKDLDRSSRSTLESTYSRRSIHTFVQNAAQDSQSPHRERTPTGTQKERIEFLNRVESSRKKDRRRCWENFKKAMNVPILERIIPMNWAIEKSGAYFGTGVASFFEFQRFIFRMNLFIAFIYGLLVLLPFAMYPPNGYKELDIKWLGLAGLKGLERTFFYYDGYRMFNDAENLDPHAYGAWNLPVTYCLAIIAALVVSAIIIIRNIGTRLGFTVNTKALIRSVDSYPVATAVFGGYDYMLSDPKSIDLMRNSIGNQITEAMQDKDTKKRSFRSLPASEKRKLIARRVVGMLLTGIIICASGVGIWWMSENQVELEEKFAYSVAIIFSLFNLLVPLVTTQVVNFEKWTSIQTTVRQQLLRIFVIKQFNLLFLIFNLFNMQRDENAECVEGRIGQEFWRLLITDFVVGLAVSTVGPYVKKKILKAGEFDLPKKTMAAIYRQSLLWIGMVLSPMIPILGTLTSLILFYAMHGALYHVYAPPKRMYSTARQSAFNYWMLLVSFIISCIPGAYFMYASKERDCGPFDALVFENLGTTNYAPWELVNFAIKDSPQAIAGTIDILLSPLFLGGMSLLLMIALYVLIMSHKKMKAKRRALERELRMEREDKLDLLRATGAEF